MSRWIARSLILLFHAAVVACHAQNPSGLSLVDNEVVFSSGAGGSLPDMNLFRDPANNRIGVVCISQPPLQQLQKLGVPDLSARLDLLSKANDLRVIDGHCSLTFPVLVGQEREELQAVADQAADKLAPEVARFVQQLGDAVPNRRDMVFHLLWSRVMDDAWDRGWTARFKTAGPPNAAWVIYPGQGLDVGTNYGSIPGNGSYALTWSPAIRAQLGEISGAVADVFRVAWGKNVSDADADRLRSLGFLNEHGKSIAFTFRAGDPTDRLLDQLTTKYAELLATAYDYDKLGKQFDLTPEQMFLILGHETAYAIFGKMSHAGLLDVPPILIGQGESREFVRLLSLKLAGPPGPADDAMYLFIKSGWRGNADCVAAFRHVIEVDPQNLDARLYLGMSLYEVGDYRGAIPAFDELTRRAGNNFRMRDWGRIWSAQMYDLLGERLQALQLYRVVAGSQDTESMQFGQYEIGPVTAREWATQRLQSPFARR